MDAGRQTARFDWLAELAGASALALGAAYAGFKAAPSLALPGEAAMVSGGFAFFAAGLLAMRAVRPAPRRHALPQFAIEPLAEVELLLDQVAEEPLLLDVVVEEPLLLDQLCEDDALLLEDALPPLDPDHRVIELFASLPPTADKPGQRIDRHRAMAPRPGFSATPQPPRDASAALFAALDELRRSLR